MTSNLNIFVIIIPIAFYIICIINPVIIATNYHELFSLIRIVFYRDSVARRARAILLVFKKIYSCLFIPNCIRNHVIT